MICLSCQQLADWAKDIPIPDNDHRNGGRTGQGLKCEYPLSCACQHRPSGAWRNKT